MYYLTKTYSLTYYLLSFLFTFVTFTSKNNFDFVNFCINFIWLFVVNK